MRTGINRRVGAIVAGAALLLGAAALAETAAHDHGHDHGAKGSVYEGYFEDARIAARPLADWAGEWRSVYPLLVAGTLEPVMTHKAEHGDKSAEEYRAYYEIGYATDVDRIVIDGDVVRFESAGGTVAGTYAGDGFEVLTYEKGNRGVRFVFRKVAGDAAAPGFIQFSDHKIAPETSDHFHLYAGDDRAALLGELTNWPTYYPASLDDAAVVREMIAH
ncbi:metal-binding protein ZinT [Amaricoccus sp.]|uniref:ZinT family metal-binding protein n=1 Tax=Amaricoccus sp. TaxID=1872485 RepID=UPI001B7AF79A|nr:metal-binding protein ZinT [Amaricoccus sp.]MBP7001317.1 metal-binding protein ZinT [Amaricoccus sp.]